jgi:hypothetical protein
MNMSETGTESMQLMRIGCFALLTAMLAAWISGEAVAKARLRLHHARNSLLDARVTQPVVLAPQPPGSTSGTARYYGGPKSPMWR